VKRWVPPFLALTALLLVPWTIWLATTLPSHEVAEHWDVAWAGLDAMLAAALLATALSAWLAAGSSRHAPRPPRRCWSSTPGSTCLPRAAAT